MGVTPAVASASALPATSSASGRSVSVANQDSVS